MFQSKQIPKSSLIIFHPLFLIDTLLIVFHEFTYIYTACLQKEELI
jgi:hypothetical protein